MDVAPDRVNGIQASRLRHLKEMQEHRAHRELSKKEAQRQMATLAVKEASLELEKARQHCATAEAGLYQELMRLDSLSSATLDRHHLYMERLAAEITFRRQMLDDARIAQKNAEIAASETRDLWVTCSAAKQKWLQIDDDVRRAIEIHSETAGEIEADDEILLRYGRLSLAHMSRKQIR
ncbi:hypothetical protein EH240_14715 [Mesorhizobium tamadayense]|uniref:Type III secretion protein n=1 Tax=Mesorhizobium tamadayense TaxID=425306 RepID=A0A3P3FSM0_9HYPH|nr:hypothetical protein [Mesorhizobium tamadayense]RRI01538.1 hypothetical protein EH240_14715 [Mesorhizobium tamadayense]